MVVLLCSLFFTSTYSMEENEEQENKEPRLGSSSRKGRTVSYSSELIAAVKADDLEAVTKALLRLKKEKKDINEEVDKDGRGVLHYARSFRVMKFLLDHGANPNQSDNKGYRPLHVVRDKDLAELLKENRAILCNLNNRGQSVLHTAENADLVHFFLDNRVNLSQQDHYDFTPLAAAKNEEVALALVRGGARIEQRGRLPALAMTSIAVARLILDEQPDAVYAVDFHGHTLLHRAVDAQIIALLIDRGARLDAKNKNGDTPLHLVQTAQKALQLLKAGASVYITNIAGKSPRDVIDDEEILQVIYDYLIALRRLNASYEESEESGSSKKATPRDDDEDEGVIVDNSMEEPEGSSSGSDQEDESPRIVQNSLVRSRSDHHIEAVRDRFAKLKRKVLNELLSLARFKGCFMAQE